MLADWEDVVNQPFVRTLNTKYPFYYAKTRTISMTNLLTKQLRIRLNRFRSYGPLI